LHYVGVGINPDWLLPTLRDDVERMTSGLRSVVEDNNGRLSEPMEKSSEGTAIADIESSPNPLRMEK